MGTAMTRCLCSFAAGLFIWLAATASVFAAPETVRVETMRKGDVVAGSLSYGRRTFALPPGSWRLISMRERDTSNSSFTGSLMLEVSFDQVVDRRLSRTLELVATKYSKAFNWLDDPCKHKGDSYWIDDRKRGMNDQYCVRVGFRSNMVVDVPGSGVSPSLRGKARRA
jgi:hypothetical protein